MGARLAAILWEVSAKKVKNFSSLIRLPHLKIDYKKVPSALRMTHNGRAMHWRGWGQLAELWAFGVGGGQQPRRGAFFSFCSGFEDRKNSLILTEKQRLGIASCCTKFSYLYFYL
ncbi:hypothetical protein D3A96_15220 [Robertkochia marina]|nr:hypothetical protein D3A96_15220 [Robertkochia marina]